MTTTLQTLTVALDHARPFDAAPIWIRVRGPVTQPLAIEEDLRLDRLIGFVAPAACSAVGVIAPGWASTTAGHSRNGGRERIRTTVLVARAGGVAGRLRWRSGRVVDEPPGGGRILDCLHRAVGLPTDPPCVGTDVLFASIWLATTADAARAADGPLTWAEVAAFHPVAQIMAADGLPGHRGWLTGAARALAAACPWPEIRRLINDGGWEEDAVPPGAAAWMDDGMLCRWLLGGRPALAELRDEAADLLPPLVAARLRRTLRELGLADSAEVSTCTPS